MLKYTLSHNCSKTLQKSLIVVIQKEVEVWKSYVCWCAWICSGRYGIWGVNWVNKGGDVCWWSDWSPHWRQHLSHTDRGTWSRPSFVLRDCPSSSCSSTADEVATSRKDVATWWETVIECASNTSQSSLQELDLIDWLPALRLNPLRKARSSGRCYWFDLCSPLLGKRACRGAARTGPTGFLCAAAVVMSVLWYADVPDSLSYCD